MGGEAKATVMVLKVDLDCQKCYKKVKKVLCKFPQIRDQVFDDKKNTVTIRVVCCSPEKIRDKLCCKGGGSIKSIEIKEPEKSKPAEKPKESGDKPKEAEKKKEPEKPKQVSFAEVAKDADKKKEPEKAKEGEKPKDGEKKKDGEKEKPKDAEKPAPKQPAGAPEPLKVVTAQAVQGYPSMYPVSQYYDGFSSGPGYPMYGGPPQGHYIQYDGYYGRPVYDSWAGSSAGGHNYNYNYNHNFNNYNRSGYEENPACTIM